MPLFTYDPKEVSILVGGVRIHGFAEGTFFTVSREKELWAKSVGSDGEGIRSKSNDRSGRAAMTLQDSSDSNLVLQAFQTADDLTGSGIITLKVKDKNGSDNVIAPQVWVVGPPDLEKAQEAGAVEWFLDSVDIEIFHGGMNLVVP